MHLMDGQVNNRRRWKIHRTLLPCLVLALCWGLYAGTLRADSTLSREYEVKAAFLYNFTKFIEWPSDAFSDSDSPIVIGILGSNPFGTNLEEAIQFRKAHDRSIVIREFRNAAAARSAQIIFVDRSESAHLPELKSALAGTHALVVSDVSSDSPTGVTINFLHDGDKLRFEINMDEAEEAGVKISAQLQKLATVIHRKSLH